MSSNLRIPRTCQYCNKAFIAKTTVTKYCSDGCAKRAYKKRKRDEKVQRALAETKESLQTVQTDKPIHKNGFSSKEFLSISEVSDLLGVSRWTIHYILPIWLSVS